jgi:hypothetical protein
MTLTRILAMMLLAFSLLAIGCGGGSMATQQPANQAAITSAEVFSNTAQTWNYQDALGHHMTISPSPIACAFGSCGDITIWHYTKDSCAGYWNPHTPEQCAVATTLDELYFVLRRDADGAWRCIGFTYTDYLGNKFKVLISRQPNQAAPYTIIPASSAISDPNTAYDALVLALPYNADLTDFSAPASGTAFSTSWRTDASADAGSLISLQHEGCVTERWTFDPGKGLDKVIPMVGLGNGGACLTMDSRLTMNRL